MPRRGGGGSGSLPSRDIPLAVRRMLLEQRLLSTSSGEGSSNGSVSGSKSEASDRSFSPSSSLESGSGDDSDSDNDINSDAFLCNPEGHLVATLGELAARNMRHNGQMLLLFETPSGFALFSFFGGHCYIPDSVNNIWAKFPDYLQSMWVVTQKGFLSFEDKSSAINADTGVDKKLGTFCAVPPTEK